MTRRAVVVLAVVRTQGVFAGRANVAVAAEHRDPAVQAALDALD